MLLGLLAILLTLILVIGIHEIGHAGAAKFFGVKIQRISLGFGKPLLTWKGKSGCEWAWSLLPLGGYVQLLNSRIQPVAKENLPLCFDQQAIWVRCCILLAGAGANLLLAWLLFTVIFLMGYPLIPPVIQQVIPHSLLSEAGFKAKQRILSVNGNSTQSWEAVGVELVSALGQEDVPIDVSDKQGMQQQLHLNLHDWRYQPARGSLMEALGIRLNKSLSTQVAIAGQPFFQSIGQGLIKLKQVLLFYLIVLKQLLTGWLPFSLLLGPLGFFAASIESFLQGLTVFFYSIANLSLAVALVNLLPIPGLDGGLLIYAVLEKLRGKAISVALEVLLYRFAIIAFVILFVQLILNDFNVLCSNMFSLFLY